MSAITSYINEELPLKDRGFMSSIAKAIFPDNSFVNGSRSTINSRALKTKLTSCLVEQSFNVQQRQVDCIENIYFSMQARVGTIVYGKSGAGKSVMINTVLNVQNSSDHLLVKEWLFPNSLEMKDLYGFADSTSLIWQKGIITKMLERIINESVHMYIVLDGELHSYWAEHYWMAKALNHTGFLILPNGDSIYVGNQLSLVFETDNLISASPSTIASCNLVCVSEDTVVSWKDVFVVWLASSGHIWSNKDYITERFEELWYNLVPKTLGVTEKISISSAHAIASSKMLGYLLNHFLKQMDLNINYDKLLLCIDSLFAVALTCSFALHMEVEMRKKFDLLIQTEIPTLDFPDSDVNIFDVTYDCKTGELVRWPNIGKVVKISSFKGSSHIFYYSKEAAAVIGAGNILCDVGGTVILTGAEGVGKSSCCYAISYQQQEKMMSLKSIHSLISLTHHMTAYKVQKLMERHISFDGKLWVPTDGENGILVIEDLHLCGNNGVEFDEGNSSKNEVLSIFELFRFCLDQKKLCNLQHEGLNFSSEYRSFPLHAIRFMFSSRTLDQEGTVKRIFSRFSKRLHHIHVSHPSTDSIYHILMQRGRSDVARTSLLLSFPKYCVPVYVAFTKSMKISPATPHYKVNLAELVNLTRSVLQTNVNGWSDSQIIQLVVHEIYHTFTDRANNEHDLNLMKEILIPELQAFCLPFGSNLVNEVISGSSSYVSNQSLKSYSLVNLPEALQKGEYSHQCSVFSGNTGRFVLSLQSLQYIVRVARVISNDGGHVCVVGNSGIGRKSYIKLACIFNGQTIFDLTNCGGKNSYSRVITGAIEEAGLKNSQVVLLMTEEDLHDAFVLESLYDIMGTGSSCNLHSEEGRMHVVTSLRESEALGLNETMVSVFFCRKFIFIVRREK